MQQCRLIIFSNFYCIVSCCLNLFSCQICFFVCIYYSSCMHICILLYIHVTVLYYILASFQKMKMLMLILTQSCNLVLWNMARYFIYSFMSKLELVLFGECERHTIKPGTAERGTAEHWRNHYGWTPEH